MYEIPFNNLVMQLNSTYTKVEEKPLPSENFDFSQT